MGVPNTFANATATIPLIQLDQNFATNVTIGSSQVGLGNTIISLAGLDNVAMDGFFTYSGGGQGENLGWLITGNIGSAIVNGITVGRTDAILEVQNTGNTAALISIVNTKPTTEEAAVGFYSYSNSGAFIEIGSYSAKMVNNQNGDLTWRAGVGISPTASNGVTGDNVEPAGIYCFANISDLASINMLYNAGGDARDHPPPDGWVYNYGNSYTLGTFVVGTTYLQGGDANEIQFNGSTNSGLGINDSSSHAGAAYLAFRYGNVAIGSIASVNSTAVVYNTTSDETLKSDWRDPSADEVRQKLCTIYVGEHSWAANKEAGRFVNFKAQQGHPIHPQAFTPPKPDGEGKETHWMRAVGEMEPLLVLGVQKIYTELDELKARVVALEGK